MTDQLHQIDIPMDDVNVTRELFGINDIFLRRIEEQLDVKLVARGGQIFVKGEKHDIVETVLNNLLAIVESGISLTERDVIYAVKLAEQGKIDQFPTLFEDEIIKNARGNSIRAKTLGQQQYVHAIENKDLVFGIGPAGTGKTYLAVVKAVQALKEGKVRRIILTRPAVEAGESLGFLPGDMKEKVDPYLRPLYDALHDILGKEHATRLVEREVIEIAPLAYMRGRTLEEAFIILDEAQNTTPEQMKMFLTRLGFGSKMIITGDVTQIDLPRGMTSGLSVAIKRLKHMPEIAFIFFDRTDVVRHPLVQKIIDAYEED